MLHVILEGSPVHCCSDIALVSSMNWTHEDPLRHYPTIHDMWRGATLGEKLLVAEVTVYIIIGRQRSGLRICRAGGRSMVQIFA